jgi:pimeloyl-ACP methyl ester carboxylesterase
MALVWPASAYTGERVDITAMDGVQLVGELTGTTGPGVVVVGGNRDDDPRWKAIAETIAAHGFRVLRFDPRGHGASSGSPDLGASDRDLEGAYRYLLARKVRPVYLVGTDVGASAALVVATRVPVAGVAIVGDPPTEPLDPRPARRTLQVPVLALPNAPDGDADVAASVVEWLQDPRGPSATPSTRGRP